MRKTKGKTKKGEKAHTRTLRELKYSFIKKDVVSLQVNTAILEAF